MSEFHLAQFNVARMRAPLDSPVMAGFVARLEEINALADCSPGFIWRLQAEGGNATYIRPYDDDRIIVNMSVWTSIEALEHFVYRSAHAELLRARRDWFEQLGRAVTALWWVPAGHLPDVGEARGRLERLQAEGPSAYVFTFKARYPAETGATVS